MAENQTFSDLISSLAPGMVVDANGEIAVIVDVLRSQFTETVCLLVRFPRNVGNARPYDMLEVSPQRTLGVEHWRPATPEELEERLAARRSWLERELGRLREMAAPTPLVREAVAAD
ncbi:MAG: hypothetical protein IPM39_26810 [Chloroflexi bacterium]|jgi:hypothetical protein|nr:hypothetical protein [Chloroflexota bacterium]